MRVSSDVTSFNAGMGTGLVPSESAVSFMMLHLTCCSNQVILLVYFINFYYLILLYLSTFLNIPSYPNFTELSRSYLLGHSWKFTFLDIEYLLNSCPSSIVKWVQCCFLSWNIRKWKYFWIGGSFVRCPFFV